MIARIESRACYNCRSIGKRFLLIINKHALRIIRCASIVFAIASLHRNYERMHKRPYQYVSNPFQQIIYVLEWLREGWMANKLDNRAHDRVFSSQNDTYRTQNIGRIAFIFVLMAHGLIVGYIHFFVDIFGDETLHQVTTDFAQKFARIIWTRR